MESDSRNICSWEALSREDVQKVATERISQISKEFEEGFKFLSAHPRSVTFFGSTHFKEDNKYYKDARELSGKIVKELCYSIVSGGGPGIMEAADRGAYENKGEALGLLINLPDNQPINDYLTDSISFYYFFARKVCLTFGAEVFIFYPGGFGTLDEFFEIVTLVQTKKVLNVPIICVGSEYWNKMKDFMKAELLSRGTIEDSDLNLFTITDDHDKIIDIIKNARIRDDMPFELDRS